jgi:hypothetical protein
VPTSLFAFPVLLPHGSVPPHQTRKRAALATVAAVASPGPTTLRMKLLVDTRAQRVLFAEASKNAVDFLFLGADGCIMSCMAGNLLLPLSLSLSLLACFQSNLCCHLILFCLRLDDS